MKFHPPMPSLDTLLPRFVVRFLCTMQVHQVVDGNCE